MKKIAKEIKRLLIEKLRSPSSSPNPRKVIKSLSPPYSRRDPTLRSTPGASPVKVDSRVESPLRMRETDSPKRLKLSACLMSLLMDRIEPDFELRLHQEGVDHTMPCHKAILATRCPFFAAALRVSMLEAKTGVMTLNGPNEPNGISVNALNSLLIYVYTGKLHHLTDPLDCLFIMSAANYYGLAVDHLALLIKCSYTIRSSITIDNCLEIYSLAHQLAVKNIEEKLLDFILLNYQSVAPKLVLLPMSTFMQINVAFNLKLLQKFGPFS